MTPSEALQHIRTLVEASAELKDDTQCKVLLIGLGSRRRSARPIRTLPGTNFLVLYQSIAVI